MGDCFCSDFCFFLGGWKNKTHAYFFLGFAVEKKSPLFGWWVFCVFRGLERNFGLKGVLFRVLGIIQIAQKLVLRCAEYGSFKQVFKNFLVLRGGTRAEW